MRGILVVASLIAVTPTIELRPNAAQSICFSGKAGALEDGLLSGS
jgi:hypothetical protein